MAFHLREFRYWLLLVALSSLIFASCGQADNSNPLTTAKNTGQKVYQKFCSACHGEDGKLKAGNAADLSVSTISEDSIRKVVMYGNSKGMGPYKFIIKDDQEINALVKHVKTLRKN